MIRKVFSTTRRIIGAALLILPLILLIYVMAINISGEVPTLFGYSTSIVITPSMSDVLPVGSIILSKNYTPGDGLEVGEIITYRGEVGSYAGKLITHKIESITEKDDGTTVIVTKGTQNTVADPEITEEQVQSVLVCKLISLGKFYTFTKNPIGFFLTIIMPILAIIAYEIFSFRRTMRKEQEENDNGEP